MATYLITISAHRYSDRARVHQTRFHEADFLNADGLTDWIRETTEALGLIHGSVVIDCFVKLEDGPAMVRMTSESLIELQRVAMARAVEAFAEAEYTDREYGRIREDAQYYAEKIRKGDITP